MEWGIVGTVLSVSVPRQRSTVYSLSAGNKKRGRDRRGNKEHGPHFGEVIRCSVFIYLRRAQYDLAAGYWLLILWG